MKCSSMIKPTTIFKLIFDLGSYIRLFCIFPFFGVRNFDMRRAELISIHTYAYQNKNSLLYFLVLVVFIVISAVRPLSKVSLELLNRIRYTSE